jgi:hypothetical protein
MMHTMNEAGLRPDVIALAYTSLPNPAMLCYAELVVHMIACNVAWTSPLTVKPASSHNVRRLAGEMGFAAPKTPPPCLRFTDLECQTLITSPGCSDLSATRGFPRANRENWASISCDSINSRAVAVLVYDSPA